MYSIRTVCAISFCSLLLWGCTPMWEQDNSVRVESTPAESMSMSMSTMVEHMSGGGVQVYNLDDDPVSEPSYFADEEKSHPADGRPYVGDSSVTVYPFNDLSESYRQGVPPDIRPPSGFHPLLPSPFEAQGAVDGESGAAVPLSDHSYDNGAAHVFFKHDSSALNSTAEQLVNRVAHSSSGSRLKVEGHASLRAEDKDPVERHITNLKTSMDRAFSVSRQLMREGVPSSSIETIAWGDSYPPSSPAPGTDTEAASRRVEIRTIPPQF